MLLEQIHDQQCEYSPAIVKNAMSKIVIWAVKRATAITQTMRENATPYIALVTPTVHGKTDKTHVKKGENNLSGKTSLTIQKHAWAQGVHSVLS